MQNLQQLAATPDTLPIFPLNSVLFPDGRMHLRVFEARYVSMIAQCMQNNRNFGICLIDEMGSEPGTIHLTGVEARIVDWDLSQADMLGLTVRGMRRFRVIQQENNEERVPFAAVRWLACEPEPVAQDYVDILPLLQVVAGDEKNKSVAPPFRFEDANWVGFRYAEFLPIPSLARQRLLELEDATLRLSIIRSYLIERGLLKK